VERSYEGVDKPEDVQRDEDGRWFVRQALACAFCMMAAEARRYHVALIDPLPAGFEALTRLGCDRRIMGSRQGGNSETVLLVGPLV